jgi:hypothetical protein
MTARKALVQIGGSIQELPSGDTLVGAGSATITEIEIDFGSTAVVNKVFTITDAGVSGTSKILATQSGAAPTGRSADENEFTALLFNATPGTGQFFLNAFCVNGKVAGKHKVNYTIG